MENEKLKTLKDIWKYEKKWINENTLKAEAVKWVKMFRKNKEMVKPKTDLQYGKTWLQIQEEKIQLLINFFNLTDEDLK